MVQVITTRYTPSCHIVVISLCLKTRAGTVTDTSGTTVEDKPSGLGLPADVALLQHRPAQITYVVPHGAHQDGSGDIVFRHSGHCSRVMTRWEMLLADMTLQQPLDK